MERSDQASSDPSLGTDKIRTKDVVPRRRKTVQLVLELRDQIHQVFRGHETDVGSLDGHFSHDTVIESHVLLVG